MKRVYTDGAGLLTVWLYGDLSYLHLLPKSPYRAWGFHTEYWDGCPIYTVCAGRFARLSLSAESDNVSRIIKTLVHLMAKVTTNDAR